MPVPENYNRNETQPESKHLRAEDFKLDQKWRLVIEDVELVQMEGRDGKPPRKRLVLKFEGREKTLVLNGTNQSFLEERLGYNPNDWIGTSTVLWRTTTKFGEKTVAAFRFIEAKRTKPAPKPAPKPAVEDEDQFADDDSVPFAVLLPVLGLLPLLGMVA